MGLVLAHAGSLVLSMRARASAPPGFWYAFAMIGWSVFGAALGTEGGPVRDQPPVKDAPDEDDRDGEAETDRA